MRKPSVVHGTFTIERTYPVPPARVFQAWADPSAKLRWFACHDEWELGAHEMDFRVGGKEHLRTGPRGGTAHIFNALYHDIVPNQRIIYSYGMQLDEQRISVSLATVEFRTAGAGTKLVFTEQGSFLDGYEDIAGREEGTRIGLDNLDKELRRQARVKAGIVMTPPVNIRSGARALLTACTLMLGCGLDAHAANTGTIRISVPTKDYAPVNGLKMYYEVHGAAKAGIPPLVLLHGGGSTIEASFGTVLRALAAKRQVIAFEQQGHGRTADIVDRPFSFEQSADDAAALLRYLKVERADFAGYSNGANIAMQVAIRHPELVRKEVVISGIFRTDGLVPELRESLKTATPDSMPAELRNAYLKAAPHPEHLPLFVTKSAKRMLEFKDWPREAMQSIRAPTLVMLGDADVIRPEHAVEMFRLLPHAELAVLPGTDHMQIIKRDTWLISMIESFLDAPGNTRSH